ncbi:MAG: hypothetical protein QOG64_2981, partial [Acidimicrobiaceae bacterium]|nr:hypothetical protein [Acidimicrobiaceae bacterium]
MDHEPLADGCWLDDRVEVGPSAIAGRGLFATVDLPAGTVIAKLGGRLVSTAELEELLDEKAQDREPEFVDTIAVENDLHLVLPPQQPIHFGNHSCDPNLWHVGPFALATRRAVPAGDELTVDYGTQTGLPGFFMACRCGSASCRGAVTGEDWRRPELRARYGSHWVPVLGGQSGLDLAALAQLDRAVRRARRLPREASVVSSQAQTTAVQARWRRLVVTHAVARLPSGRYHDATLGGLQDSSPRAALLALHARMEGVGPDAWEDPSLAQIWLRGADYLVPRRDLGVFTLGTLPRDERLVQALEGLADAVLATLDGDRADSRLVGERLAGLPNPTMVRAASATGRVHIRWDTRRTEIIAADRPALDPGEARVELARRFLHWHGPANSNHFARWAGISRVDADRTWDSLSLEIVPVAVETRPRWMLAADLDALLAIEPPAGPRLLPPGDPCLFMPDGPAPPVLP